MPRTELSDNHAGVLEHLQKHRMRMSLQPCSDASKSRQRASGASRMKLGALCTDPNLAASAFKLLTYIMMILSHLRTAG
jgi:hypothetical protein